MTVHSAKNKQTNKKLKPTKKIQNLLITIFIPWNSGFVKKKKIFGNDRHFHLQCKSNMHFRIEISNPKDFFSKLTLDYLFRSHQFNYLEHKWLYFSNSGMLKIIAHRVFFFSYSCAVYPSGYFIMSFKRHLHYFALYNFQK